MGWRSEVGRLGHDASQKAERVFCCFGCDASWANQARARPSFLDIIRACAPALTLSRLYATTKFNQLTTSALNSASLHNNAGCYTLPEVLSSKPVYHGYHCIDACISHHITSLLRSERAGNSPYHISRA